MSLAMCDGFCAICAMRYILCYRPCCATCYRSCDGCYRAVRRAIASHRSAAPSIRARVRMWRWRWRWSWRWSAGRAGIWRWWGSRAGILRAGSGFREYSYLPSAIVQPSAI
ncbi:hypothetical protein C8R44DRAFT_762008 [Mycena epipterygia]|nr:hypothetical protein C8R44DRAFT_762008 [Mycena epipterygia]